MSTRVSGYVRIPPATLTMTLPPLTCTPPPGLPHDSHRRLDRMGVDRIGSGRRIIGAFTPLVFGRLTRPCTLPLAKSIRNVVPGLKSVCITGS